MKNGSVLYLMIFLLVSCTRSELKVPALVRGLNQVDQNNSPGYALFISLRDSVVLTHCEGIEDLQTKKPITIHSLFNTGSISKTFVAYTILHLAHEGKINLSDSLIKYFPAFKHKELGAKVRLYHLLTHSSGLPDNRPVQKDSLFFLTADDEQNWAPILQNDSLNFEPGTRYQYSNPAFNALALIIQQVTGIKWQDYIKIKIFSPSRMTTSTITDGAHPDSGVTHAYLPMIGGNWKEQDYGEEPTFNAAGNGGVWSSVHELSLYERAIKYNEFFEPEVMSLSRLLWPMPNWMDSIPSPMGLSWFIETFAGYTMYSHTGSQGGFTGDFVSIPEIGFFYTLLSNTPAQILQTRLQVLDYAKLKGWIRVKE